MFWDRVAGVYDLFADIFNKKTHKALLAAVKPFCEKQVRLGNMTQSEADEIIARHSR